MKTTEKKTDNRFYGQLLKYDASDFAAIVEARYGWAVGEQAASILLEDGLYSDQNPNALELIKELAQAKGETELAESLGEYLNALNK